MRTRNTGSPWILVLLILVGLVIGGVLGEVFGKYLPLLAYSKAIGLEPPMTLNLGVLTIVFGFKLALNLASLLGLIFAIFIFRRI